MEKGEPVSVEMKLGRWEVAGGRTYTISKHMPEGVCPWVSECGMCWTDEGKYWPDGKPDHLDLVRYLGPIELSPTPACADQAGTPVVSTVSTETAGEQLQRMRDRFLALQREVRIYSALLPELERAMSDLEERIKAMEKEVEG